MAQWYCPRCGMFYFNRPSKCTSSVCITPQQQQFNHPCLASGCNIVHVGNSPSRPAHFTYCNNHVNQCFHCSTRIASGQTYCYSHQNHSCSSCNNSISYYETHCSNHVNSCRTCGARIASGQTYCVDHVLHKCQDSSCLSQIVATQPYCSNHINFCSESDCSLRIPNTAKYCSSHKKKLLENDEKKKKLPMNRKKFFLSVLIMKKNIHWKN